LVEEVDAARFETHVGATKHRKLKRTPATKGLHRVRAVNRGISRIERISAEQIVLKIHTVLTFRVGMRYARFEVINEIEVNKTGRDTHRHLVQTRTFGESPRPLTEAQLVGVLRLILGDVLNEIAKDVSEREVDDYVGEILPSPEEVAAGRAQP
jgi:hypothetical protein